MLRGRELIAVFRDASWPDKAAVQRFIRDASEASPQELAAMLQILSDQRMALQGRPHALRCAVFERAAAKNRDPVMFVPFIKAMRDGDRRVRESMGKLIPGVNQPSAHRELVTLLKTSDSDLRTRVLELIREIGSKQTFDELAKLVRKGNFPGRREAVAAIVDLGGSRSLDVLADVLESGSNEEQLMVLRLLARKFGSDKAAQAPEALFPILERLSKDTHEPVAMAAIRVLSDTAPERRYLEFLDQVHEDLKSSVLSAAIGGFRRFSGKAAIWRLREFYRVGSRNIKTSVLDVLESIGGEESLIVLDEALNADHISVRLRAAHVLQALGKRGDVDVSRTVIWLLRSHDPDIRRIAADIASSVKDPDGQFWPDLLANLRDEDWWVRERITDALTELAGTELTRYAFTFLREESAVHRRFGVDLLVKIRDPQSLGALVRQAQEDEDWWVRERCVEAIGLLADQRAVPYIIDLMERSDELIPVGIEALTEIGGEEAASYIASILGAELPDDTISHILDALREIGGPSLSREVAAIEGHANPQIQNRAAELLTSWNIRAQADVVRETLSGEQADLDQLLFMARSLNAEDVILAASKVPWVKTLGEMKTLGTRTLSGEEIESMIVPLLSPRQQQRLSDREDVDFSYQVIGQDWRYRVNVFFQHTGISVVLRQINEDIPRLEALGLPDPVMRFGDYSNGLILVGGPTGSGKSTTLAAIIDYINRTYGKHIITLEDPIEVVHKPDRSLINQREVGQHASSFHGALRSTLREDPDVILVGEMRDLDTIAFAISAAETGHLVLGTVHTMSSDTTVDRLLNAFPAPQQPAIRSILANCLRAVCCQQLIPTVSGEGRELAVEVMLNTDAVSALIRKGKTYQLASVIATGRELGMQSMDSEILRLLRNERITPEEAYLRALDKKEFESFVGDFLEKEFDEESTTVADDGAH